MAIKVAIKVTIKVAIKVVIVLEKFREKKKFRMSIFSQSGAFKCKEMERLQGIHSGTYQGLQFQKDA